MATVDAGDDAKANPILRSLTSGRPGGLGWRRFSVTKRQCHPNNIAVVTIRQARKDLGSVRDNAVSTARSDNTNRGLGFVCLNTAISWRNAKASFDAGNRAGNVTRTVPLQQDIFSVDDAVEATIAKFRFNEDLAEDDHRKLEGWLRK